MGGGDYTGNSTAGLLRNPTIPEKRRAHFSAATGLSGDGQTAVFGVRGHRTGGQKICKQQKSLPKREAFWGRAPGVSPSSNFNAANSYFCAG
jgi:hypothetical protein